MNTAPSLADLRTFAAHIAREAGDLTIGYFQTGVQVERKADGTPVTRADREAEMHLRRRILERFPGDAILGEEFGTGDGDGLANASDPKTAPGGRTWILDPIDGTKAFVHGVPLYSVLVAVAIDRQPVVGVIHLPALGETVAAHRGGGCRWIRQHGLAPGVAGAHPADGEDARVSTTAHLLDALVTTSDFPGHEQPPGVDQLYAGARLRRTWGDAYGYALVATGRADVMIDPVVAPWDVAAVAPIIEEAGGRFTALDGRPGPWHGSGLATNGRLHEEILDLLDRRPTG